MCIWVKSHRIKNRRVVEEKQLKYMYKGTCSGYFADFGSLPVQVILLILEVYLFRLFC
jgi:hypothetical protein